MISPDSWLTVLTGIGGTMIGGVTFYIWSDARVSSMSEEEEEWKDNIPCYLKEELTRNYVKLKRLKMYFGQGYEVFQERNHLTIHLSNDLEMAEYEKVKYEVNELQNGSSITSFYKMFKLIMSYSTLNNINKTEFTYIGRKLDELEHFVEG